MWILKVVNINRVEQVRHPWKAVHTVSSLETLSEAACWIHDDDTVDIPV